MTKEIDVSGLRHADFCEVRTDQDGILDEIVASGVDLHIERLSGNQWWVGIIKNGKRQRVVFHTDKANIAAITESD